MLDTTVEAALENVPSWLFHAGWQAAVLALLAFLASRTLHDRLEPRWRFCLWLLVLARLALPVLPAAPWSLYCLVPWTSPAPGFAAPERSTEEPSTAPVEVVVPPSVPVQALPPGTAWVVQADDETARLAEGNFPWLTAAWLAGVLVLLGRQGCLHLQLHMRQRTWRAVSDPLVADVFERCRQELGVVRPVRFLAAPLGEGPATCGAFRAAIVLPKAFFARMRPDELRLILLHELTHIGRHDVLLDRLAGLVAILHWFNPVAWLALAGLRHERELACDAAVLRHIDEEDIVGYGRVLLHVAEELSVPAPLPGAVGVIGKDRSLVRRIRMIAGYRKPTNASRALGLLFLLVLGAFGLTEAAGQQPSKTDPPPTPREVKAEGKSCTIAGLCQDEKGKPLSGVRAVLHREDHVASNATELQTVETGKDGRFRFRDVPAPPNEADQPAWGYGLVLTRVGYGSIATSFFNHLPDDEWKVKLRPAATLRGRVTDPNGKPVAGARVWAHGLVTGPVQGVCSTQTDADGRYAITDMAAWGRDVTEPKPVGDGVYTVISGCYFDVLHPDYAHMRPMYRRMPDTVDVVLQPAGVIEGRVVDQVTGKPAKGAAVSMQATDTTQGGGWQRTQTDAEGKYRLPSLIAGKYNVWADAPDRVCAALDSVVVTAGKTLAAPDLVLIEGGWIEGRLVEADSGKPIRGDASNPGLEVGLYGPSRPKSGAACQSCPVDERGRFRLRVAPGVNFPYVMNPEYWQRTLRRDYFEKGVEVKAGEVAHVTFRVLPTKPVADPEPTPVRLPVPVSAERDAAATIRQLGGWYQVDADNHVIEVNMVYHETPDKRRFDNDQADTDEALRVVSVFPRLKRLFLKEGQASDDALQALAGLDRLEVLYVWDARRVTDTGIGHLVGLSKLRDLHFSEGQLGDGALAVFAQMPNVRSLSLQGNAISDNGLKHLAGMKQLRSLWVGSSRRSITDEGVKHLAGLTALEQLDLQGARVTDAGLANLEGLKRLRTLYLAPVPKEKPLTDACVEHLLGMRKLQQLGLQNTRLTDRGVERLLELPELNQLMFSSSTVSEGLQQRVQKRRPELKLYWSQPSPQD